MSVIPVQEQSARRMALGSLTAFAVYVGGVGLTYFAQLLIARMVGADHYGVYAYVLAWIVVLAYFSALGFDVALLRFIPTYQAMQAWGLLRGVIRYAERRAIVLGVGVAGAGILLITLLGGRLPTELRNTFVVGFLAVPVLALLWIRCSIARAFGGVASALAPDRMVRDGVLIVLIAAASWGLQWNIDAPLVMTGTLASAAIGLAFASIGASRLRPAAVVAAGPMAAPPVWRAAVVPLVLIAATEALMNRTGVLLLGWLGYTRDAGIYNLAFNIAFLVTLPRTAVNTLFAPASADLFARKELGKLQSLVTRAASWTFCGGALIGLGVAIFAEPLLGWFGSGYDAGLPAIRILVLGQVIASAGGSQIYVMTMTGHERNAAKLMLASALANAGLGAALIGVAGLTGAAVATALTLVLWNAAMASFLWRRLGLFPGVLGIFQPPRKRPGFPKPV